MSPKSSLLNQIEKGGPDVGLPSSIWKELEAELSNHPEPWGFVEKLNAANPLLGSLAIEAGFYELGLNLGQLSQLEKARAFFFTKRKKELEEYLQSLQSSSSANSKPLENLACEMLGLKWKNSLHEAIQLFEMTIEKNLLSSQALLTAEICNQAGSLYYNVGKYRRAFDLYVRAFVAFKASNRLGSCAIAAYNAWTAASQLGSRVEVAYWKQACENLLAQFDLPSLKLTVQVSSLQQDWAEGRLNPLVLQARILLDRTDLSAVQQLITLQTLASALVYLGHVSEAQVLSVKSRDLMSRHKFFNYQPQQNILEQEISYFQQSRAEFKNFPAVDSEPRAQLRSLVLRARLAQELNLNDDFEKLYRQIEEAQTSNSPHWIFEDLTNLRNQSQSPVLSIVAAEANLKKAWLEQDRNFFSSSSQTLVIHPHMQGPRAQFIAQMKKGDGAAALEICETQGMLSLKKIALTFLPQKTKELLHLIDSTELPILFSWEILNPAEVRKVTQFGQSTFFAELKHLPSHAVLINLEERTLQTPAQKMDLKRAGIIFDLLVELFFAGFQGLAKEDILRKVWKRAYDPLFDDPILYANLKRLRQIVSLHSTAGRYYLDAQASFFLIRSSLGGVELNERQKMILDLCQRTERGVQRSTASHAMNCSERTILRELTQLVSLGILKRTGSGRGTYYQIITAKRPA